jgi:tetratricopeptide (TPR) repeat protein
LTDIFGVESEIAKGIADSLQAKLTGREEQALAAKPTNNPEAYEAYLRGLAFQARSDLSSDLAKKAIGFFERAVQLDPNFAFAWARLSRAHAYFYIRFYDVSAARRDAAKRALDHAQRLQLNSPETQFALGYYQYWLLRDYELAKTTFGLLGKLVPGNSEIPLALGSVARRQGNWDESIAYLERGLALDPHNYELLKTTAWNYVTLRQYPSALRLYDRALDIAPNDLEIMAGKANIYQAQGNLQESAKLLVQVNEQTDAALASRIKIIQLRLERNHGDAIRWLQTRLAQFHFASEIDRSREQVALALVQRLAGDSAGATFTAGQVRNTLELLCKNQPESVLLAGLLSLAKAVLGEKVSALKEAERAVALLTSAKELLFRPAAEEAQLLIQMMFGENSSAISTLNRLLRTEYISLLYVATPVTPALLRLDPYWDPLRSDPAFQKLCEEKKP